MAEHDHSAIKEDMNVIGADGVHIGTVDHLDGERIKLTRADSVDGRHHYLPAGLVAAVEGGCFGAAVALTLACDIVIAGDAALFATTPAKLGIGYPASDVARLRARVGAGQAARMLFTGDRIEADEAVQIGLAHLRAADAGSKAQDLAAMIADNDPVAVRLLKSVLRDPGDPGHDLAFEDAFGSPAFAARLDAFLGGKR